MDCLHGRKQSDATHFGPIMLVKNNNYPNITNSTIHLAMGIFVFQSMIPQLTFVGFKNTLIGSKYFLGLCPDWEDWETSEALENVRTAMELAEKWLSMPQVSP